LSEWEVQRQRIQNIWCSPDVMTVQSVRQRSDSALYVRVP
jgi:hypothetical protein